jgi:hypothetical protein
MTIFFNMGNQQAMKTYILDTMKILKTNPLRRDDLLEHHTLNLGNLLQVDVLDHDGPRKGENHDAQSS